MVAMFSIQPTYVGWILEMTHLTQCDIFLTFTCEHCGKQFHLKWRLTKHMQSHLNKINRKCSYEISARYKGRLIFCFYTFLLLFQMQAGLHPCSYVRVFVLCRWDQSRKSKGDWATFYQMIFWQYVIFTLGGLFRFSYPPSPVRVRDKNRF